MNAIKTITPVTTVEMTKEEFDNMRKYAIQKREAYIALYKENKKVSFTACTLFLAFAGFLDF